MSILKRLSSIKEETPVIDKQDNQNHTPISLKTYFQNGEQKCKDASGEPRILKSCLEENYEKFKEESRKNRERQQELKSPIQDEKKRQESILKGRQAAKEIKEDEIEEHNREIEQINQDITNVRSNPEKYGLDINKRPKASFFIGLILLIPMTLYLFVFYISASFSAFFKNFTANTTILESIFDGKAISKAYYAANGGALEVIFICTIPFVFIGLGYLIHMFQQNEENKAINVLKIIGLFVVTFIFDTLLAYQIEKSIYEVHKTLMSPPFNLRLAFQSPSFWIIIFSGFVVYIIWGIVFDFVMKEYANIDKIKVFINSKKKERKLHTDKIIELKAIVNNLKQEISLIEGKITELQSKLDGFIFENKAYLLYHTEFVSGWHLAIGSTIALSHDAQKSLLAECEKISSEHLNRYHLSANDTENIIYTKSN